jgi:hypothetical protein
MTCAYSSRKVKIAVLGMYANAFASSGNTCVFSRGTSGLSCIDSIILSLYYYIIKQMGTNKFVTESNRRGMSKPNLRTGFVI